MKEKATVKIWRKKQSQRNLSYGVFVDGEVKSSVCNGRMTEFDLVDGIHNLNVRMSAERKRVDEKIFNEYLSDGPLVYSNTIHMNFTRGYVYEFECGHLYGSWSLIGYINRLRHTYQSVRDEKILPIQELYLRLKSSKFVE